METFISGSTPTLVLQLTVGLVDNHEVAQKISNRVFSLNDVAFSAPRMAPQQFAATPIKLVLARQARHSFVSRRLRLVVHSAQLIVCSMQFADWPST
jgi:hypothetical protein